MQATHATAISRRIPRFSAPRDWMLVAAIPVVVFFFATRLELNERIVQLTRPWESLQIDELPVALLALALTLAWVSLRQRRLAQLELQKRREAEIALEASRKQLLQLSHRMTDALESERRQIAHELHDELGQVLNAIKLEAVAIRNRGSTTDPDIGRSASAIAGLADGVYNSVRQMLYRLRPVALDELGLDGALEQAIADWQRRMPETGLDLRIGELPALDEASAIALYRAFQEALTNAVRHAHASRVSIRLGLSPDGGDVLLLIADDGRGAAPEEVSGGLGLAGMRERVQALGGLLDIACAPGEGFSLSIRVPNPAMAANPT